MALHTPLYDLHIAGGGKMVDFAGYSLPVHYGSLVDEHHSVRQSAGMFDVSHMCIVDVHGDSAQNWLRSLLTNDVAKLADGGALYSCMCREDGGIIDDLIAYRINQKLFRLIVNAGTQQKDMAWFEEHLSGDVSLKTRDDLALIAIQGPKAVELTIKAIADYSFDISGLDKLERFSATADNDWFVARTGYTGEDGFEIALPIAQAAQFWEKLLALSVKPAGLGARDTLRLESGMSLYGNDLDENHSPVESGIAWTVDLKDASRQFVGRDVLEVQKRDGARFHQIGLTLIDRGVLRQGQRVELNGKDIGEITSGTFSPTLQKTIALARVCEAVVERCEVRIREKACAANIAAVPFFNRSSS